MQYFERLINDPVAPLIGVVLVLFLIIEADKVVQFFKQKLAAYHGAKSEDEDFHKEVKNLEAESKANADALTRIDAALANINSELKDIKCDVKVLKEGHQSTLDYRKNREEKDGMRDRMSLGMARSMLIQNYEKCVSKGIYTVDEQEVYHELYEAYIAAGGNGVIKNIRDKIIELPDH